MPPGVPLLIRSRICASVIVRKVILFASAGARSPPAPPSPWHPAQTPSNCFFATAKPESGVCAIPGEADRAASISAPAMVLIMAVSASVVRVGSSGQAGLVRPPPLPAICAKRILPEEFLDRPRIFLRNIAMHQCQQLAKAAHGFAVGPVAGKHQPVGAEGLPDFVQPRAIKIQVARDAPA